jgi:hypothetical protein
VCIRGSLFCPRAIEYLAIPRGDFTLSFVENGQFTCYDFTVLDSDRHAISSCLPISAENSQI